MRLTECPECYGTGKIGKLCKMFPCDFCEGKKKVNIELLKWMEKRLTYEFTTKTEIENKLEDTKNKMLAEKMNKWDKKNPKPRKFKQ